MSDNDQKPKQFQRGIVDKAKDLAHDAAETVKEGFNKVTGNTGRPDYKAEHQHSEAPMDFNDKGVEYTGPNGERMIRLP